MIVIVLVGGDRGAMSLIALAGNILCLQNGQQVFYVDKKGQLVLPEKKKTAAEKTSILRRVFE